MEHASCTTSTDGQSVINPNASVSYPEFSTQLTGSVYFSFPPPPCAPSPLDTHHIMSGVPMQLPIHTTNNLQPENGVMQHIHQQVCSEATSERIAQMSDAMTNTLHIDDNAANNIDQISRPGSVESATVMDYPVSHPYSVVLPPGSFVHHLGGTVPSQVYHQFSPALPAGMSQFHPVYPINMISRDHSNPAYIQVRQPTAATDCSNQNMQNQSTMNMPMCTPHIPEAPWPGHPAAIQQPNPSLYWGHYMTTVDKAHGIALTSQPFMRRHSICDDSAVVTPTNVIPPCNLAGIVSATPEFIHPRKPDVPQWLMSPPVGEQDPSIISYAPMMYHNVRVPSLTGIAIPFLGPVGAAVPEAHKIDSPALVMSPVPFYENSPMPLASLQEVPQESEGCDVFCDPAMQSNELPAPPINVMHFEQHNMALVKPKDFFSSQTRLSNSDGGEFAVLGQLLAPTDFDSGYDSSRCGSMPNIENVMENYAIRDCETQQKGINKDNNAPVPQQMRQVTNKNRQKKFKNPDGAIIANLKRAAERCNKGQDLNLKNGSSKSTNVQHPETFGAPTNDAGRKLALSVHGNAEISKQTRRNHTCLRNASLIYSYLLNAAVNLSAASNIFLRKKSTNCTKHSTGTHKKCGFSHRKHSVGIGAGCVCSLQHAMGPPLFKRVAELQQQPQCWQCVVSDKTPEIKHPTPDLFNRWPNIPPPPAPSAEDEDCQSVCSSGQMVADALPLAAALFHNELTEQCCQNNQDDDQQLPPTYPIGVFWDIENCAVPTGKSALSIVQRVRERFFTGHKEAEFMCVCDINKESRHVIQDLNNAQVNVVHINATAKNAADDKLRQSIRRFAHNHPAPATLVLITGDSNFTSEVSDLRHRHKYFVVLIHPTNANHSLLQAATTVICYEQLVADLPIVHVSPKVNLLEYLKEQYYLNNEQQLCKCK